MSESPEDNEDDDKYLFPFVSEEASELLQRFLAGSFVPPSEEEHYQNWKLRYPNIPEDWTNSKDSYENIVKFFMKLTPERSASLPRELIDAAVYYPCGYEESMMVKLAVGTYAKLNNETLNYLIGNSGVSVDTITVEAILLIQLDKFDLEFEDLTKITLESTEGRVQQDWLKWIESVKGDYKAFHN
jgi:hypothetical protein